MPYGSPRFIAEQHDSNDRSYPHPQHLADIRSIGGQAAAYVCLDFACEAPVGSAEALLKQLNGNS